MEKTNAMRILDQRKISYKTYEYPHKEGEEFESGVISKMLNIDGNKIFKTLVLTFNNHYYVCDIPVNEELDLKKAAKAFNVKSLEMVHVKDLFNITGYIRGGCSPIGMKKSFPTIIDSKALNFESIIISGGKIGLQIEIKPDDLAKVLNLKFINIIRGE